MRRVPTGRLEPGLVLARPIFSAEGTVLLAAGVPLKADYIRRLKELNITAVYVQDERLAGVEVRDVVSDETRLRTIRLVKEIMAGLGPASRPGVGRSLIGIGTQVRKAVNDIIDELLANREVLVNLTDIRSLDEYTYGHSVNVCILSVMTGISLGYDQIRLRELGVGALLHDVGKTMISDTILNKPGSLTPAEFDEVKRHSEFGFEILRAQDVGALAAHVAYQHHERYNGEGYPRGLTGGEIHEFGVICGVCDVYDALVADRVYREAYLPHEAVELLSGSGDHWFDFRVVKSFLDNIAPYPVGSTVLLSNREVGMVVRVKRGLAHRPVVRIISDAGGRSLSAPRELDLAGETTITIVDCLDRRKKRGQELMASIRK